MPNAFSVNLLFYVSDPRVVAPLQPWADIGQRLRRSGTGANDLLDKFLGLRTFQQSFCARLFELARQRRVRWETRCLAVLMLEHQILKLRPDNLAAFDYVFAELKLKVPGVEKKLTAAVLKESYSTTEFRPFIRE